MPGAYRSPEHAEQVRDWCRTALGTWQTPHQTHAVETSLGRTHVVSLGDGDPICVYLCGTNFNAATSTGLLEALAGHFRVYAADLPGQPGLSAAGRPQDEVSGYARWLSEVLIWIRSRHPDERTVLAGHSRGAAVALSAAPDSVDGLVLLSPAGLVPVRPTLPMLRATLPWLLRRDEVGSRRLLHYMSGPGHEPSPRLVDWMALVARTCHTTGAPGPYPDALVTSWRGRDVRVAVGERDVFLPVNRLRAGSLARLQTDVTVIANAGHLLVDEEPRRVTALLTELPQH